MRECVYSPHFDFFIDWAHRNAGYNMRTFHVHKKYEIYYEVEGTRRYYIDDVTYLVNAGSLILIGPDSVHKTGSVDDSPHTRYVINFSREYLAPMLGVMPDANLFACFETGMHLLSLSPKKQAVVEGLLSRIWERSTDTSPCANALRQAQMAELLLYLGEYAEAARKERDTPQRIQNKTVDKIQSYVSTHYQEELTLTGIAAQFYMSPYYVSRLFKKTTNLSLVEYINSVRVMAAKNLLETTELRVARIAEDTGFTTSAHFSRMFKQGTGLSPQQYRKFYRNTQLDT